MESKQNHQPDESHLLVQDDMFNIFRDLGNPYVYASGSTNIAGWKMGAPDWVNVFPIENGDIPASYVRLPEGS